MIAHTITVMLGGPSHEREVSLRTGVAVARALRSLGHTVLELDPATADWKIPEGTELVFLALHGTYGEDGTIQKHLDELGVPYTGCGPEASALAFDKVRTKKHFLEAGLATPKYLVVEDRTAPWPEGWEPPVVLKPVQQGSSVGLQFVTDRDQWPQALEEALAFDQAVLVEEKIEGRETTVGILDHEALPIVEIRPKQGAFDYSNKYTVGATEYDCPADFPEAWTRRIQEAALQAFEAIGGRDYGRVDQIITAEGRVEILEVNTLPGMTETSLLPKAAAKAGLDYADLCQKIIDLVLARPTKAPQGG